MLQVWIDETLHLEAYSYNLLEEIVLLFGKTTLHTMGEFYKYKFGNTQNMTFVTVVLLVTLYKRRSRLLYDKQRKKVDISKFEFYM